MHLKDDLPLVTRCHLPLPRLKSLSQERGALLIRPPLVLQSLLANRGRSAGVTELEEDREPLPKLLCLHQPSENSGKGNSQMTEETNDPFVPGNTSVKVALLGGGTFFCHVHEAYIKPLIIRVGAYNYPACEDCFLDDLKEAGGHLGDPIEPEAADELGGEAELEQEDEVTGELITGA